MQSDSSIPIENNTQTIHLLKQGDKSCFRAFYKFYYKPLCAFASHWVPLSTAEDIVQDTMLYIWEKRELLMEDLSLKGLVFMIVKNKALNSAKRCDLHSRIHEALQERYEEQFSTPDFYLGGEMMKVYTAALATLPEQTRRIFEMSRFGDKTHAQIARELDLSPQSVNYHIGQALKILRVALKDYTFLLVWLLQIPHE